MHLLLKIAVITLLPGLPSRSVAQTPRDTSRTRTVVADSLLQNRSLSFQKKWGRNRRTEWGTPVRVPVLRIDTTNGGLIPYQRGGGNESKTLRLRTNNGKEYTLRSIYKSRDAVIEPRFKNTFIEDIILDGLSCSYPYGAFAVSGMQEAAGIHHTLPQLVYLPRQAALDSFNERYGNDLYLFEQRPDGNWEESVNLGQYKDFTATIDLIGSMIESNHNRPEQYAFIKARLFDMLIADWDRHEDNWRWGVQDSAGFTKYGPVPRDRDQAFYTHNGWLVDFVLPLSGLSFMQNFDYKSGDVKSLNIEEKDMDRFFSNEMSLNDWKAAARELQSALTDTVITQSVRQLPPEVFAVSGNELIEKLKARRGQLEQLATSYYLFIAKEVEVPGSKEPEYFEVRESDFGNLVVSVYRINEQHRHETDPYFKRVFKPSETMEVRLFSINGNDIYSIENKNSPIRIRVIGGPGRDTIQHTGRKIQVYDNPGTLFHTGDLRLHEVVTDSIGNYKYASYYYVSKGFNPVFTYDREDKASAGLNYGFKKYKWHREPFATKQNIGINYSFSQHAISASYTNLYPGLPGKWDLFTKINWDAARWTNFFGLGNETARTIKTINFYRLRSQNLFGGLGMQRKFNRGGIELLFFYQQDRIKPDSNRFATKQFSSGYPKAFESNQYAGTRLSLHFAVVDDPVLPIRGFTGLIRSTFANNFTLDHFFQHHSIRLQGYIPLGNKFSLALVAGGASVFCDSDLLKNAQVIQHAVIGGPESLRGYRLERFWGKTSFYNNNELRFITNIRSHLVNAKAGLFVFFDDGRVWMPDELSRVLHTSYGSGILFAPFDAVSFTITYGISKEAKVFQFRMNALF